jgi:hypothetical protein
MSERSGVYDCFGPFERMGVRIMGLNKSDQWPDAVAAPK